MQESSELYSLHLRKGDPDKQAHDMTLQLIDFNWLAMILIKYSIKTNFRQSNYHFYDSHGVWHSLNYHSIIILLFALFVIF